MLWKGQRGSENTLRAKLFVSSIVVWVQGGFNVQIVKLLDFPTSRLLVENLERALNAMNGKGELGDELIFLEVFGELTGLIQNADVLAHRVYRYREELNCSTSLFSFFLIRENVEKSFELLKDILSSGIEDEELDRGSVEMFRKAFAGRITEEQHLQISEIMTRKYDEN